MVSPLSGHQLKDKDAVIDIEKKKTVFRDDVWLVKGSDLSDLFWFCATKSEEKTVLENQNSFS